MSQIDPDDPLKKQSAEDPLKGCLIGGAVRVELAGLARDSIEYEGALVSISLLVNARRLVLLDEKAREAVRDLDIFEWSVPYPEGVKQRPFPFFPGDRARHDDLARLESEYVTLKRAESKGEPFRGTFRAEPIDPNTPTTFAAALAGIERRIDELVGALRRRCEKGSWCLKG
jgi:hypothetical protein